MAASGSKGLRVPGAKAACGGKGGGSWEVKPEAREAGTREAVCAGYGGEPHPESLQRTLRRAGALSDQSSIIKVVLVRGFGA